MTHRTPSAVVVCAALIAALVSGGAIRAQATMNYVFLLVIDNADTKQALKSISDQVDGLLLGRNLIDVEAGVEKYEYYVLAVPQAAPNPPQPVLDAYGSEIRAQVRLGFPSDCPKNVLVELTRQNQAYRQVVFGAGALDGWMTDQLTILARVDGADHYWVVRPGQTLNITSPADLLGRFTAY